MWFRTSTCVIIFVIACLGRVSCHPGSIECKSTRLSANGGVNKIMQIPVTAVAKNELVALTVTASNGKPVVNYVPNQVVTVHLNRGKEGTCCALQTLGVGEFLLSDTGNPPMAFKCPSAMFTPNNNNPCPGSNNTVMWSANQTNGLVAGAVVDFSAVCGLGATATTTPTKMVWASASLKVAAGPAPPPTPSPPTTTPTPSPSKCSCCDGTVCKKAVAAGGTNDFFTLAWTITPDRKSITVGVTVKQQGWVGVGLSSKGKMIGSYAVIGTTPGQPFTPGEYTLTAKDVASVKQNQLPVTVTNFGVDQMFGTDTRMTFTRKLKIGSKNPNADFAFGSGATTHFILAAGTADTVSYHKYFTAVDIDLASGSSTTPVVGMSLPAIALHAAAMMLAWGAMLPIGILMARLKGCFSDGAWFKIHMILQISGFSLALCGFIVIVVTKVVAKDPHFSGPHARLGLAVTIMSIVQPVWGLLRPHGAEPGQPKPLNRVSCVPLLECEAMS